ncbi:MAG: MFS transporter [Mesorhizobium sp.]|uniref:MFS transporter n=1 Tax=Mesorhizobium sp. TaxID=1871066 RepID=UPI000FE911C5|nr:MFS transporter [Mesorhizobium sp.]RWI57053.1 MAG: MFS transporter [Mesorhizobium sp.]
MQDNRLGTRASLAVGHTAAMIDLVALPVWVGVLLGGYGFSPSTGGGLVTLFLCGAVVASFATARFFRQLPVHRTTPLFYLSAALAFIAMLSMDSIAVLTFLHFVAGLCVGAAGSSVHGTMGRMSNPHRVFALGNLFLGCFAVAFLGTLPMLIAHYGRETLFVAFAVTFIAAALATLIRFPKLATIETKNHAEPIQPAVWFLVAGVMLMALVQSMTFSFLERVATERGFDEAQMRTIFLSLGIINIFPPILAAMLQRRLNPTITGMVGAMFQAVFSFTIMNASEWTLFAPPAIFFSFAMIFTHTFLFGRIAALEPSGRISAATPAMLMTGSSIGPFLGGILVETYSYGAIGKVAVVFGLMAAALFFLSARYSRKTPAELQPA